MATVDVSSGITCRYTSNAFRLLWASDCTISSWYFSNTLQRRSIHGQRLIGSNPHQYDQESRRPVVCICNHRSAFVSHAMIVTSKDLNIPTMSYSKDIHYKTVGSSQLTVITVLISRNGILSNFSPENKSIRSRCQGHRKWIHVLDRGRWKPSTGIFGKKSHREGISDIELHGGKARRFASKNHWSKNNDISHLGLELELYPGGCRMRFLTMGFPKASRSYYFRALIRFNIMLTPRKVVCSWSILTLHKSVAFGVRIAQSAAWEFTCSILVWKGSRVGSTVRSDNENELLRG